MKIVFATDHAGFEMKNLMLAYVRDELHFEVEDCGAYVLNELDDYTNFIGVAAQKVAADPEHTRAIIFGGSGQGEAMFANRFKGVRTAVYYGGPVDIIRLSREHNDANILAIGARFVDLESVRRGIVLWLNTRPLTEEKYARRIRAMDTL